MVTASTPVTIVNFGAAARTATGTVRTVTARAIVPGRNFDVFMAMFPFPYLHTWLKQEAPPGQAPQSTWTPKLLPEPHCHSLPQRIGLAHPLW